MQESFAQLLEQNLQPELHRGSIVKGEVIAINDKFITIDAGLKSEGIIPINEFQDRLGELEVTVGEEVEVAVESVENGLGETLLSRERAKRIAAWSRLIQAHDDDEIVEGVVVNKVKGGFTVDIEGIRAFLPGSLVDTRPLRDTTHLENKKLEFKLVKIDEKRNNIVVSHRAVIEAETNVERATLLENLEEGQQVTGIVKNLTDYGAFIDLGGVDGLLHITDISWKRINHPSEEMTIGDEVLVKVLKFDRETNRVSLGMKQLKEDPWQDLVRRHPEGSRLFGRVSNITDYGCFVEIEESIEGLVHMSEMDWTDKNVNPKKLVSVGYEIEVMVLEIDEKRRRISLGLKQCIENPWEVFEQSHNKGDKVQGKIRSITDFGIFIGLDNNIDGLVHLSDISWSLSGEEAIRNYSKGQEVEAVILAIDASKERISLGIKQLSADPLAKLSKGMVIKGIVTQLNSKLVTLDLGDGVIGHLKVVDISKDKISDLNTVLKIGQELEAKIINVDRKNNIVNLSIKAKERDEQKAALRKFKNSRQTAINTTLGDLIKEKIKQDDDYKQY